MIVMYSGIFVLQRVYSPVLSTGFEKFSSHPLYQDMFISYSMGLISPVPYTK